VRIFIKLFEYQSKVTFYYDATKENIYGGGDDEEKFMQTVKKMI